MPEGMDASFAAARAVMRHHAHTFYFAALWLRTDHRRATHALYALFRTLDDLVDDVAAGQRARDEARAELGRWRAWLLDPEAHPRTEPILPAVRITLTGYDIPVRHFLDLIDALEMDLDGRCYEDFAALAGYCYRVASTVGLAMCRVLGAEGPTALARAAELGVAMQLTNILRDVREDFGMGRVYLPRDLLASAGWDDARLARGLVDESFREIMRDLVALARTYYTRGMHGLPYLSPDARFAILVASRCYAGILHQIERADYDVFSTRAHVSGVGKLAIALRSLARRGRAVGPLPPLPSDAPSGEDLIASVRAPTPLTSLASPLPSWERGSTR